jgi:hypothetical protein
MNLNFKDSLGINDKKSFKPFNLKTKVVFSYTDTGEILFTKSNKITLAGAGFLARALFDLNIAEVTPSYNNALSLDNTVNTTTPTSSNKTHLFCVGIDGCGVINSDVYVEDYKHWISPANLVPFQYLPSIKDLDNNQRQLYFGKKTSLDHNAYYFKAFDSNPTLTQQLTDGTTIDNTIYDSTSELQAQTIVSMQMSISDSDCRDYFIETTGIADARINSISLCTGWAKTIDNFTYYQDIRPCTRLNFPNEALIDLEKGITINYYIYF